MGLPLVSLLSNQTILQMWARVQSKLVHLKIHFWTTWPLLIHILLFKPISRISKVNRLFIISLLSMLFKGPLESNNNKIFQSHRSNQDSSNNNNHLKLRRIKWTTQTWAPTEVTLINKLTLLLISINKLEVANSNRYLQVVETKRSRISLEFITNLYKQHSHNLRFSLYIRFKELTLLFSSNWIHTQIKTSRLWCNKIEKEKESSKNSSSREWCQTHKWMSHSLLWWTSSNRVALQ